MRRTHRLALATAVLAGVAQVPSWAAPSPGVEFDARAVFRLVASGHAWELTLDVLAPAGENPATPRRARLLVRDLASGNHNVALFESVVRSTDATVAHDQATFFGRLGGLPLQVEWTGQGTNAPIILHTANAGMARGADAKVVIGRAVCWLGSASIGVQALSIHDLQESQGPVAKAFSSRQLRNVRCAAPPS
jgi:hypothetical protein